MRPETIRRPRFDDALFEALRRWAAEGYAVGLRDYRIRAIYAAFKRWERRA